MGKKIISLFVRKHLLIISSNPFEAAKAFPATFKRVAFFLSVISLNDE